MPAGYLRSRGEGCERGLTKEECGKMGGRETGKNEEIRKPVMTEWKGKKDGGK